MSGDDFTYQIEIPSERQMHELGLKIGAKLEPGDLVSLNGPLGAGKTTLTRGIGEALFAQGNISSPTFLIARTHPTKSGTDFVHIDAYRLKSQLELDDLDIDFSSSICVIEWGRGFAEGLVTNLLEIDIAADLKTDNRLVSMTGTGKFSNPANLWEKTQ